MLRCVYEPEAESFHRTNTCAFEGFCAWQSSAAVQLSTVAIVMVAEVNPYTV